MKLLYQRNFEKIETVKKNVGKTIEKLKIDDS